MEIITDKSFKYDIQELVPTSDEFILVKGFYDTTFFITYGGNTKDSLDRIISDDQYIYQIYKVNENNSIKAVNMKRNNLMLFHGTDKESATGILKEGFKNSKRGWFGQGVYLTDCSNNAYWYSTVACARDCDSDSFNFIFVNEVLESEKLETLIFDSPECRKDVDNILTRPFTKHMYKLSPQLCKENYKEDFLGRQYRNVSVHNDSTIDEYVAAENVTIPRYLIVQKEEATENLSDLYELVLI